MAADVNGLRIGAISSVNLTKGTARVLYDDRDGSVTPEFPFIAWEFWMPEIGQQVLVGHLANGSAHGVIIGPVWNDKHRPPTPLDDYYVIHAQHVLFEAEDDEISITLARIVEWLQNHEDRLTGHGI